MRSAPLLSGNVMKIFRFRDRLAGGALYSGRWGRPASCSYLYSRKWRDQWFRAVCLVFCTVHNKLSFIPFVSLQVCLAFGALILFAGLIVLLVGYTTPARIEAFGEDDLLFVDRYRDNRSKWEHRSAELTGIRVQAGYCQILGPNTHILENLYFNKTEQSGYWNFKVPFLFDLD